MFSHTDAKIRFHGLIALPLIGNSSKHKGGHQQAFDFSQTR